MTRHSELYEFHRCALCRKVPRREHFVKIPFLPLVLEIALFQSLPKIDMISAGEYRIKTNIDFKIDVVVVGLKAPVL